MRFGALATTALCASLGGCGTILQSITHQVASDSVGAAPIPITDNDVQVAAASKDINAKKEFLGHVAFLSEQKCGDYVKGLVLGENTINTTGDVLATVFSALSTAVAPPGTKTALSAASTIASGSKADIDADIYAKAAIADFATAIQNTYYANIKDYTTKLPTLVDTTDQPLIISNEVAKIQSYHSQCSLASAESAIQAKLGESNQQQSGNAGSVNPPVSPLGQSPRAQGNKNQQLLHLQAGPTATTAAIPGSPW